MQIKITIDDDTYKKLKKSAKDNLRSLSNEAFFRLRESFISRTFTPTPIISPTIIPVEPYKITLTNSTNTEPTAQTGEGTAAVQSTTTEQQLPAGITDAALQEKIKELKRREIGGDDEYYRQRAIEDLTKNNKKPIGTVYESTHKPTLTITDDDFDEPEPEWDADRGGARPRVL